MRERMISAFLVVVLMLTVSANAAFSVKSVMPSLSLDISGGTAQCSALVRESGKKINVTMELWSGGTLLATWTGSGTNYATASGSYTGVQLAAEQHTGVDGAPVLFQIVLSPLTPNPNVGAFGCNKVRDKIIAFPMVSASKLFKY